MILQPDKPQQLAEKYDFEKCKSLSKSLKFDIMQISHKQLMYLHLAAITNNQERDMIWKSGNPFRISMYKRLEQWKKDLQLDTKNPPRIN